MLASEGMAKKITAKQAEIVSTIRNFAHVNGYTPSIREIANALGKARGTIMSQIQSLNRKGVLRTHAKKARAIEILQPIAA
jgi:repressor LexA